MRNRISWITSLLIWEVSVFSFMFILLRVNKNSFTREALPDYIFAFLLGFAVVSLCLVACRRFHVVAATVIAGAIGVIAPVAAYWIWGLLATPKSFEIPGMLWVHGLFWAAPSGLASSVIGGLLSKPGAGVNPSMRGGPGKRPEDLGGP